MGRLGRRRDRRCLSDGTRFGAHLGTVVITSLTVDVVVLAVDVVVLTIILHNHLVQRVFEPIVLPFIELVFRHLLEVCCIRFPGLV